MPASSVRFRVVQLELPGTIDLPDGRWTVRGHANRPQAVVVTETTEAARRRYRRRRNDDDEPVALPAVRVTVIDADPLEVDDPDRWLARTDPRPAVANAVATVSRLLHLHAIAAAEPVPRRIRTGDVTAATIGYASGEEAADGRLPNRKPVAVAGVSDARRIRRSGSGMGPDERLADLLAGRDVALASELLVLRARDDLAQDRTREAALQLRVALEAAIAELEPWRSAPGLDAALTELRDRRGAVAEAAAAAVRGGLDEEQVALVKTVVAETTKALRARNEGRRVGERPLGPTPAAS